MSLIYRDYRYVDYFNRKYFDVNYFPLQSIKPQRLIKRKSGFPFNSKTLRSEVFADYDFPGPGSYDSTSHSIEGRIIKYPNKLHHIKEQRMNQGESNNNLSGPGEYELLSSERRSRMRKQNQLKIFNSKRFTNIIYQNHKPHHKVNKSNHFSLILTGDKIKDESEKDSEKIVKNNDAFKAEIDIQNNKHINLYHTYAHDIKEQRCTKIIDNSEFTFDINNNDSKNNNNKESKNQKTSQAATKDNPKKEVEKGKLSAMILCNQLFKVKRFLNSTLINEKRSTNLLMKKANEEDLLSYVGPGSYNTNSQFELKRRPVLLQNFDSSNIRRFDYLPHGNLVYRKNSTPGPGAYFIEKEKIKSMKKSNHNDLKQTNVRSSFNILDKTIYPGPGSYELDKPSKKKHDSINLCFSSSEKRFQELSNILNEFPGPTHYFSSNDTNITVKKSKSVTPKLTKIPITQRRQFNVSQTPNACINDYSERIDSLYHNIYNKNNKIKESKAPFGSAMPKQFKYLKSQSTVGPGDYHQDISSDLNKRDSPKFGFSQTKQGELFAINTLTKDLSQYSKDSYFNWHKKSFNKSLV